MKHFLLLFFALTANFAFSQNSALYILKKADQKLSSVYNAFYTVHFEMKGLGGEDTTEIIALVYLKKSPEDELGFHHNINVPEMDFQQIYNGSSILLVNHNKETAEIVDVAKHGLGHIRGNIVSHLIPHHIFKERYFQDIYERPITNKAEYNNVLWNGEEVHAVSFSFADGEGASNLKRVYYFRMSDYLFVGYEDWLDFMGMYQYKKFEMEFIKVNSTISDDLFNIEEHITDKATLETFEPYEGPFFLDIGTPAPNITGKTILDEEFNLHENRGKVVVLDFWYRSCYGCILAMPDIQKLSEEFKNSEVVVMGVNPHDDKQRIIDFLKNRDISKNSLYKASSVPQDFNVVGYPIFAIIDKEGKVAHYHFGWNEDFYETFKAKVLEVLE